MKTRIKNNLTFNQTLVYLFLMLNKVRIKTCENNINGNPVNYPFIY
jgi:hypothetical protein